MYSLVQKLKAAQARQPKLRYTAGGTSGHFTVDGVVQAANTTFAVSQAQLAHTTFTAGSGVDHLVVNVWDGVAYSGPHDFLVV